MGSEDITKIPENLRRPFPLCSICPKCESSDVHGKVGKFNTNSTWNLAECKTCGYRWKEKLY